VLPDYQTFDDLKDGSWIQKAFVCRYKGEPLITHYCQGKIDEDSVVRCDQVIGDVERRREFYRLMLEYLAEPRP
jgi:hypothetical protein